MSHEMVAALVILASGKPAGEKRLIERKPLGADSPLQLSLRLLSQRRSKHGIDIVENRTVGLEEQIHVLMGSVSGFSADTEVLMEEKEVSAEDWVSAAANALRGETSRGFGRRGSSDCADAKSQIKLLGVGSACCYKEHAKGRNY